MNTNRLLLLAILATTVTKLALAWNTLGTNDVMTWKTFTDSIHQHGGAWLYQHDILFNHPPFMVQVLKLLHWLVSSTGIRLEFLLRLLGIIADIATILLVARLSKTDIASLLVLALSPIAIFVSGFHGNTDPVMICLVVLAIYLFETQPSILWAGLAFGMAMNIKIVPVILLPVFFLLAQTARRRILFLTGVALAFLAGSTPLIFQEFPVLLRNVVGYGSLKGIWGVTKITGAIGQRVHREDFLPLSSIVMRVVFPIILTLLAFLLQRRRVPLFKAVSISMFGFLAITPGFGVQYLIWLVPFSVTFGRTLHLLYTLTGGVFLFSVYTVWSRGFPWYYANSLDIAPWAGWLSVAALTCWFIVVICASTYIVRGAKDRPLIPLQRPAPAGD
jgi:hypothetical protein